MATTKTAPAPVLAQADPNTALSMDKLPAESKAMVDKIVKDLDIKGSQDILQYGVGTQTKISEFSDNVLQEIRSKDTGFVGDTLTSLMLKVKDLGVDKLDDKSIFDSIPFVGSLIDKARTFVAKYEKLSVQIENITASLDQSQMQLLKDITLLDKLYDKNVEYIRQVELYIIAGNLKIKEMREVDLPKMQADAEKSGDPVKAQQLNDYKNLINNFERKVHDLQLTRIIGIQTAPQIRIVQGNDQVLAEKIQSSILHTIPLWKNQIVIAITILRQKKALEAQQEVSKTTNALLKKNAEILETNAIGIATEIERGVVDVETLQEVNTRLIRTIEETLQIQAKGKEDRKAAEVAMQQIESDLKQKLTEIRKEV